MKRVCKATRSTFVIFTTRRSKNGAMPLTVIEHVIAEYTEKKKA